LLPARGGSNNGKWVSHDASKGKGPRYWPKKIQKKKRPVLQDKGVSKPKRGARERL